MPPKAQSFALTLAAIFGWPAIFGFASWALFDNFETMVRNAVAKDGYLTITEADRRSAIRTAQVEANTNAIKDLQETTKDTNDTVDVIQRQIIVLDTKQNATGLGVEEGNRKLDDLKNLLIQLGRQN